jgi:branched-chain amino acid transport system ATP-binding protein
MSVSLALKDIRVQYGKAVAVRDVTMEAAEGSVTGVIGANGAGKSTIMRAISRLHTITKGEIWFKGQRIDRMDAHKVVRLGIIQVPEGRRLFPQMTVLGNIKIGAYLRNDKGEIRKDIDHVLGQFPVLDQRRNQRAETLSGGEQQMLAIARALMGKPKLLLMDEPSWGLAPLVVNQLADIIADINKQGITVFLVEQNAGLTVKVTRYAYLLEVGRVVLEGDIRKMMDDEKVHRAFLG